MDNLDVNLSCDGPDFDSTQQLQTDFRYDAKGTVSIQLERELAVDENASAVNNNFM